jgi:DNA-binding MarR family transcriptional regulator
VSVTRSVSDNTRELMRPRAIFFLNQANHAVRSRFEAALIALELTGIQYTVLSVIGRHEGLSSAELSRRFYVTPQTMNELIGNLQRRDLIVRTTDPLNRRILRMSVTEAGAQMLRQCDEVADQVEREVFRDLSDEEYRTLAELTRKLAHFLRNPDENAE